MSYVSFISLVPGNIFTEFYVKKLTSFRCQIKRDPSKRRKIISSPLGYNYMKIYFLLLNYIMLFFRHFNYYMNSSF